MSTSPQTWKPPAAPTESSAPAIDPVEADHQRRTLIDMTDRADCGYRSERVCEQAGCRVGVESDALFHWSQGNRWEGHPERGQQRHGVRR
jgi:hypothetical protein